MKESMLERFKALIAAKSKSPTDFGKIIGVPQTTLSNQLQSPRGISVEVILLTLSSFPDISAEWLLRGKGEMLISENTSILHEEDKNASPNTLASLKDKISSLTDDNSKLQAKLDYMEEYNIKIAARLNKAEEALQQYEPKKKSIS